MIILSGGTGTPKLLDGLKEILPPEELTVVVNTAEDLWVSGNLISPDLVITSYSIHYTKLYDTDIISGPFETGQDVTRNNFV